MSSDSAKRSSAADFLGVSADELTFLLDGALSTAADDSAHPQATAVSTPPDRYALDELLAGLPPEPEEAPEFEESDDDALLLTEIATPVENGEEGWPDSPNQDMGEPQPEAGPDEALPPLLEELAEADAGPAMAAIVALAHPLAEDTPPSGDEEAEDVFDLTEDMVVGPIEETDGPLEQDEEYEAPSLATAPETEQPAEEPAPPGGVPALDAQDNTMPAPEQEPRVAQTDLRALIWAVIASHCPGGGTDGDDLLPANGEALAMLLSDPPPADDFAALDALDACWPRSTQDCTSRAALAVALNLARNFGLPGKLPMASARAWRLLSPDTFQAELARRLQEVDEFIAQWQKAQRTFLILEFGEIEMIEILFEALKPAEHMDLLAGVMNFKVLSNRRMGLLRRIPTRVKRQIAPLLPARRDDALVALAQAKALLARIADPSGFAPIVETAAKMEEEIDKMLKAVAAIGAPPQAGPPGGGIPLGRIG